MSSSGVFDYVVIGGGTAGLVIAARLSENPDVSVCVLEAGKDHSTNVDTIIPGTLPTHFTLSVLTPCLRIRFQEHGQPRCRLDVFHSPATSPERTTNHDQSVSVMRDLSHLKCPNRITVAKVWAVPVS